MTDADPPDVDRAPGARDVKPATAATRHRHGAVVVDFDDEADFARAERGLIAQHPTGRIELDGRPVWDIAAHDFVRTGDPAPDTVHPGLWRQARLNAIHGLFEVADGVWQARGYDISNITFIATDGGWLIIDPLTTASTAAACLALIDETLGPRPVNAVIYTHSHADHFGGVLGVTTLDAVRAGDVRIIAPEGFMHEVVGENVLAGPIMGRRALYQFGPLLPTGPRGQVDNGLGQALPLGPSTLIAPTETISETGAELDIDGVRVVFQNTPDTEAPAEMNFFFPDRQLLCMAENCTHNLHNLYPIRGAQTRDALAWSKYIDEALVLWGERTDTMFASHHWPRFGRADVREFLELQRDVYRWMHDQTLRLANRGYTPDEISEELQLPAAFAGASHVQGYYGAVSHNVRSVYNRYLGWYDGNPANLHPLPPVEAGRRYVEAMGGANAVLATARGAFDAGDYRWVVELVKHVIFADPTNDAARLLSADAMEQLGYQSESGTWRNAYLMGAQELRHGSPQFGAARARQMDQAMSGEQLVDMIGVRFDPARFADDATFVWHLTDLGERHLMGVCHGAVHHRAMTSTDVTADVSAEVPGEVLGEVTVAADRATVVEAVATRGVDELIGAGRLTIESGDIDIVRRFLAALDVFETAPLIEP